MKQTPLILLLVIAFLASSTAAFAQKKPAAKKASKSRSAVKPDQVFVIASDEPPPPPPVQTSSKEFTSEEGGFKVTFPVQPTKNVTEIDAAYGKTPFTQYNAKTLTGFYMVAYIDFPAVIADPAEIKLRYDNGRDRVLANPARKLIEEKDFNFGQHLGREISIEEAGITGIQRFVLVEQRLFQLMYVAPLRYSTASAAVKSSIRKAADRFFASFAVTKLPSARSAAPLLPADFGVKVENGVFNSEYLGVSMNIPRSWLILNSEETELVKSISVEDNAAASPKTQEHLELSLKNTQILLLLTKEITPSDKHASLAIAAERVSYANFRPEALAKDVERFANEKSGEKTTIKPELVTINGIEFARLETVGKDNLRQRFYLANRKGLALEIVFSFMTEEDAAVMENALKTIRFK